MTERGINILRLFIAGFNGLLFTVGLYIVFEYLIFKPNRLRKRLKYLIVEAERGEIRGEEDSELLQLSKENREEINRIKIWLGTMYRNPRVLLWIALGILMTTVSLMALVNLLYPAFKPFI